MWNHPVLRRLLPGLAFSALGDGMSIVAISWLALELDPRPISVGLAVAAYSLPSALGGVVLARWLRTRPGAQLAGWNAVLRATALGAVAVTYAVGALDIRGLIALLAVSSLLAAWGSAGRYALIAELLPPERHVAANAVLTTIAEFATIAGPPLAGLLIAWTNPGTVIAIDAASFAVLALTYRLVPRTRREPEPNREPVKVTGLIVVGALFFLLFGPFYAAMPIHVAQDLGGDAALLGWYYTAFGAGAVAGGLLTTRFRRHPPVAAIVAAFGAAMLPLGLGAPQPLAMAAFAVAGLVWAPFLPVAMARLQRDTRALATFGSVAALAAPLGTVLGGPLVEAFGARPTLLLCAVATIALGAVAAIRGK
ncbi:MFS transporter [Dactylosporangium sp. AC04546]|uniref:MFS transporter n=1 Tax=Dactylosporangium sp. AC04546 TaxID=2862460 RepID=UPI001EDD2A8C|nr:MFS transporter [Dactylosporangium sp. AC04546]WVK84333.1 MFS transporter [Dactylosporangium sp. AC04546]